MMQNTRLYTFAVLYADMLTPKKWQPKYLFTIQNGKLSSRMQEGWWVGRIGGI